MKGVFEVFEVRNPIFEGLCCAIEFSDLSKIIAKLKKEEISFEFDGKHLHIKSVKGLFKINASHSDDSFIMPTHYSELFKLEAATATQIQEGLSYRADDELRPVMNTVFLDKRGYVVSSDAHRMTFEKSQEFPCDIMVSTKMVNQACTVSISDDEKWYKFENEFETIYQNVVYGTYPNWKAIVPSNLPIKTTINKKDFIKKLELCALSANPASNLATLRLDVEGSVLGSKDIDFNKEFSTDFPKSNIQLAIGFKIPFMLIILKSIKEDLVTLEMQDETRAIIINKNKLLMPMMINV